MNPLHRFFIKGKRSNNSNMVNEMITNKNVKVEGNKLPAVTEQKKDEIIGGKDIVQPKPSPGNPNVAPTTTSVNPTPGPAPQQQQEEVKTNTAAQGSPNVQQPSPEKQDPSNIDIEKFIEGSDKELKVVDDKQQARIDKKLLLEQALDSRFHYDKIKYNNTETDEYLGTRIQYKPDKNGKSIYDYMNDPVVKEHIEFIPAEGDLLDGSPVERAFTFYWIKPTF